MTSRQKNSSQMKQHNKPVVRVTQIESFRRWMYQSDYDNFEISEQSVIDGITQEFQGNEYTRIGTAFHAIVETGQPVSEKVPAGVREYTYYGKPVTEPVPCGRKFDIDGHDVIFDVPQCRVALDYRNEHPGAYHEIRSYMEYDEAIVTGCADMIDGIEIRDIKTKYSVPKDSDYINSCQWRYYMQLFNVSTFHFDLFIFNDYKLDKHGYDVRGLRLTRHDPITVYRYPGLEQDNSNLLHEFMAWARERDLLKYLNYTEK